MRHMRKQDVEMASWKLDDFRQIRRYQDDGYLVFSTGREFPIPCLYDISNLEYEYGNYKCSWGTIRRRGGFFVLPVDGNKAALPPEIARWVGKTLQFAVVTVSATNRQATVRVEENGTEVLLTDVPTWESPWSLLSTVNKALRDQGLAIVCQRLEWAEDEDDVENEGLWPPGTSVPMARNDHTAVYLTGYAHDDGILVYLGAVGHKTSLKSIWASAVKGGQKGRVYLSLDRPVRTVRLDNYHSPLWAPLPDQNAYHLVLLGRPATDVHVQDGVAITYLLVWDGDNDPHSRAVRAKQLLVERLNAALPIPILPEWADVLWKVAAIHHWLAKINTGGDCRAGYRLSINVKAWIDLIQEMVAQETLTF